MWEEVRTIVQLNTKGYTEDYQLTREGITCLHSFETFSYDEFVIDEAYHFHSDILNNECLDVCAITNTTRNSKGVLIVQYSDGIQTAFHQWIDSILLKFDLKSYLASN
jgi:hypothetical protein